MRPDEDLADHGGITASIPDRTPANGPLVLTRPHLQPTTPCRVLLDAVMRLSDVAQAVMPSKVARLDLTGDRPKVWLDPDSAPEDINRVLIEILTAITISPAAAPTARRVPSLYLVS